MSYHIFHETTSQINKIFHDDPDKTTFNIPLYESLIAACVNETCHQMGLALSETEEFRKIFLEKLEKL